MNFAPDWSANGRPALVYRNKVATRLDESSQLVEFRYFPSSLIVSVPLFLFTLGASAAMLLRRRLWGAGSAVERAREEPNP
jgi:hypothetical protein